jgi:dihydrodipicolinate synthase/N-acetylneuraminate lyase
MKTQITTYRGIVTPLVTPLRERDVLDYDGLERLIDHQLNGGVHGLFLLGTTGEASGLSSTLKREFVKTASRQINGRVPILVGVSDTSVVESLRLAQDVVKFCVDAVVVTTPYYLPLNQAELADYARLFDRESPLPVFLYNMPYLTKRWFALEIMREAIQLEKIVGVKDSSGDMNYFKKLCDLAAERDDWSVLIGSETHLADAVAMGANGGITGAANVDPKLLVALYNAAAADDSLQLSELQSRLLGFKKIYQFGEHAAGTIRGIKCALEQMGICSARMAEPHTTCDQSQRQMIEHQLIEMGLIEPEALSESQPGIPESSAASTATP